MNYMVFFLGVICFTGCTYFLTHPQVDEDIGNIVEDMIDPNIRLKAEDASIK
jgi:hypothetical protein